MRPRVENIPVKLSPFHRVDFLVDVDRDPLTSCDSLSRLTWIRDREESKDHRF